MTYYLLCWKMHRKSGSKRSKYDRLLSFRAHFNVDFRLLEIK